MNVKITTFTNPFSFFCINEHWIDGTNLLENNVETAQALSKKSAVSDLNHGQYITVMWKEKWTRGIVSMENQFLIWLVDYGIFIRPSEKTVFIDLPLEYRKYPTKIFEASIHGVVPVDKDLSEDCQILNKIATTWNPGAIEKAQELLKCAVKIIFFPLGLFSTKHNDVVIGDLFVEIPRKGTVNIIDELELWPVFLEKNRQVYIKNLSKFYNTRRRHRGCLLKPEFPDSKLPVLTLATAEEEYPLLADNASTENLFKAESSVSSDSEVTSTVENPLMDNKKAFKITPEDIEKYAERYILIHGRKYNVLNVLINKARDMRMCEQYKDLKSVGCGISSRRLSRNSI